MGPWAGEPGVYSYGTACHSLGVALHSGSGGMRRICKPNWYTYEAFLWGGRLARLLLIAVVVGVVVVSNFVLLLLALSARRLWCCSRCPLVPTYPLPGLSCIPSPSPPGPFTSRTPGKKTPRCVSDSIFIEPLGVRLYRAERVAVEGLVRPCSNDVQSILLLRG